MKKTSCLLVLLLTSALLAGCGGQPGYEPDYEPDSDGSFSYSDEETSSEETSSAPDSSDSSAGPWGFLPSDTSEPEPPSSTATEPVQLSYMATEPPLNEWALKQPIPEFLNEEQRQLFLHAYCAHSTFLCGYPAGIDSFPLADGSEPDVYSYETVEIDGETYTLAHGRYRQWKDFQTMMDGLFTSEYQSQEISWDHAFRSTEDGLLCYLDTGIGSDPFYQGNETDTYELVSQTEDEIRFNLIGHYTEWDYEKEVWGEPYTVPHLIRMVRTDRGWRVAEMNVPV